MDRHLLLTGATGALGPAITAALLRSGAAGRLTVVVRPGEEGAAARGDRLVRRAAELLGDEPHAVATRLAIVVGDLRRPDLGLAPEDRRAAARTVDGVVHAGADTRFTAPTEELAAANVEGTRWLLAWARELPRLRQVVLLSTLCVAGTRCGEIEEEPLPRPPGFVNAYEESKWEAERLAAASGLPVQVLRLATVVGSETSGAVERPGAVHYALAGLERGLVPMLPGTPEARVELLSTELAAGAVVRALGSAPRGCAVYHVAGGRRAPRLGDLLEILVGELARRRPAWRRRRVEPPRLVPEATFAAYRETVVRTGNPLFADLLAALDAFTPALGYPKIYVTTRAEELWQGPLPLPEWRPLLARVLDVAIARRTGAEPIS